MSDSWYRDPVELLPYEDGFGKLWTLDGRCLNPDPEPADDGMPNDIALELLKIELVMELNDLTLLRFFDNVIGHPAMKQRFLGILNDDVDPSG